MTAGNTTENTAANTDKASVAAKMVVEGKEPAGDPSGVQSAGPGTCPRQVPPGVRADMRSSQRSSSTSTGSKRSRSEAGLDDEEPDGQQTKQSSAPSTPPTAQPVGQLKAGSHTSSNTSREYYDAREHLSPKSADDAAAEPAGEKLSKTQRKKENRKKRKLNASLGNNRLVVGSGYNRYGSPLSHGPGMGTDNGTATADAATVDAATTDAANDDSKDGWFTVQKGGKAVKNKNKKLPKKESRNYPSITFGKTARIQSRIQVSDLRNLITYIFADGVAPQWVAVNHRPSFRKIVAILVPGLEEFMFQPGCDFAEMEKWEYGSVAAMERWMATAPPHDDAAPRKLVKDNLPFAVQPFADVFEHLWPCRARGNDKYGILHSPIATFLSVPLPKSADGKEHKGPRFVGNRPHRDVRTRITEFLATPQEYRSNNFVPHPAQARSARERELIEAEKEPGWVYTRVASLDDGTVPEAEIPQGSITAGRKVYALDCEMVKTTSDEMSLARISMLSWDGEKVMDELVKPDGPIRDYNTKFSGVTKEMLDPVTTTREQIQARLLDFVDARTILVGHSLESDMKALKMSHPFIVDTSICFPHATGPPLKNKLRYLAKKYLDRDIQQGQITGEGHDSTEDALACLDLMKKKCEKGKEWGAGPAGGPGGEGAAESLFSRLARAGTSYRSQGGPAATGGMATGKTTATVDWGDPRKTLTRDSELVLGGCTSDVEVESKIVRAVCGDADGLEVPGGGVDFVYARLRCLEALRGFWNSNRPGVLEPTEDGHGPPSAAMLMAMLKTDDAACSGDADEVEEEDRCRRRKSDLERCVRGVARRIQRIHEQLPPCTALVVFSGTGDPRAMGTLLKQRAQHKLEYNNMGKPYDQITVQWTDREVQQLKKAVHRAREGVAFVTVK